MTMVYGTWPDWQPLGTQYFAASETYTFSVGPEPLIFWFFAAPPYFSAPPPRGTTNGFVRCTLTSIRFLPG